MRVIIILVLLIASFAEASGRACNLLFSPENFVYSNWKSEIVNSKPEKIQAEEYKYLFSEIISDPKKQWLPLINEVMVDFFTNYRRKYDPEGVSNSDKTLKLELLTISMHAAFIVLLRAHPESVQARDVKNIIEVFSIILDYGRGFELNYTNDHIQEPFREVVFKESDIVEADALELLLSLTTYIDGNKRVRAALVESLKPEFQWLESELLNNSVVLYEVSDPNVQRTQRRPAPVEVPFRAAKLHRIMDMLGISISELSKPQT